MGIQLLLENLLSMGHILLIRQFQIHPHIILRQHLGDNFLLHHCVIHLGILLEEEGLE